MSPPPPPPGSVCCIAYINFAMYARANLGYGKKIGTFILEGLVHETNPTPRGKIHIFHPIPSHSTAAKCTLSMSIVPSRHTVPPIPVAYRYI